LLFWAAGYRQRRYMLNVMKKILSLIFLVFLFGCNENSVDPVNNPPNEINGQFINWNPANGDSLLWRVTIDSVEHFKCNNLISHSTAIHRRAEIIGQFN